MLEEAAFLFRHVQPKFFVDVGTGSGCIACALSKLFPDSTGLAIDCDNQALAIAQTNLTLHGAMPRVKIVQGNSLDSVPNQGAELICMNLPYIPTQDLKTLQKDIICYEPISALDGGEDGLEIIKFMVSQAPNKLASQGYLMIEVGDGQASTVMEFCAGEKLVEIHARKDLSGIDRTVVARLPKI
jgi:release factor glutamine methyltransferase